MISSGEPTEVTEVPAVGNVDVELLTEDDKTFPD